MKPKKDSQSGLERLAYYLGLPHPKLALFLPLFFLAGGLLIAITLPFLDARVWGGAPVVQIFAELLWFFLMFLGFYRWRDFYRKKYGDRAYQQIALRYFIPGASLLFAGMLRSIWVFGPGMEFVPKIVRMGLGLYLLVTGFLLERKGIQSLEIDRVMLVYTIFPERGSAVQSRLYEYLRHPLYSAYVRFSFGIALLSGTIPGLLCAFVFGLKIFILSKLEEKELIGRFGQSYKEYMKKVPAFIPRLRHLKSFWTTLLKG